MAEINRIVLTEGGKGGVAKTEILLSLIPWYRTKGIEPILLDFDVENTNRSGLQNFFPRARKIDVHADGALDEFYDACDSPGDGVIIADLPAGAGAATFQWFDAAYEDAAELNLLFTAIAATTNDAGAVQSVLKWADHLQDRVDYLVVLNEFGSAPGRFEYWNDEPAVARFSEAFDPAVMSMASRVQELQAELRNRTKTLQDVIDGNVETEFLRLTKNVMRAKRYQRQMFEGFDRAASILLPS